MREAWDCLKSVSAKTPLGGYAAVLPIPHPGNVLAQILQGTLPASCWDSPLPSSPKGSPTRCRLKRKGSPPQQTRHTICA